MKHKLLLSFDTESVTATDGKTHAEYVAIGMVGTGKTIALQGLATDKDILACFPGGILYMTLGQEATVQRAIQEIERAMAMTGATTEAEKVEKSTSLTGAVARAISWFQDKKCLFIIDDVWPTDDSPTGFLSELSQLLQGNPESRLAISTRSVNIAIEAGVIVDFGARDPLGLFLEQYSWRMR